jgi:hypothetical protein
MSNVAEPMEAKLFLYARPKKGGLSSLGRVVIPSGVPKKKWLFPWTHSQAQRLGTLPSPTC